MGSHVGRIEQYSKIRCWKPAGGSSERKLQNKLSEWKLHREVWRRGTMQHFCSPHCYIKERIQEN
jgi:hypothetical protein